MEINLHPMTEELFMELHLQPDAAAAPLHSERVNGDLADLVDETFTTAVLSDQLPAEPQRLTIEVRPVWSLQPLVERIEVILTAVCDGREHRFAQAHACGRWTRRAMRRVQQLRELRSLADDQRVYRVLVAQRSGRPVELELPPLAPPTIAEQSLESFGVRRLEGRVEPDRPILVNRRMHEELLQQTERAGATETGSAILGKILRLPAPLPGTTTRVVTILSMSVSDQRHAAPSTLRFTFDPQALAEAAELARRRGLGESVQTVFHSHGWGTACGNCNQSQRCLLPEASHVSLDDYQVLESLCPSKSTLMPIAGRQLGAEGRRPVIVIHAWRGGQMKPISFQTYDD